jgi:hypothetical protein
MLVKFFNHSGISRQTELAVCQILSVCVGKCQRYIYVILISALKNKTFLITALDLSGEIYRGMIWRIMNSTGSLHKQWRKSRSWSNSTTSSISSYQSSCMRSIDNTSYVFPRIFFFNVKEILPECKCPVTVFISFLIKYLIKVQLKLNYQLSWILTIV